MIWVFLGGVAAGWMTAGLFILGALGAAASRPSGPWGRR